MLADKIKQKCLESFGSKYPDEKKVIVVVRDDGNIRVIDGNADSMLFDHKGREIITHEYIEGAKISDGSVRAIEATFELIGE